MFPRLYWNSIFSVSVSLIVGKGHMIAYTVFVAMYTHTHYSLIWLNCIPWFILAQFVYSSIWVDIWLFLPFGCCKNGGNTGLQLSEWLFAGCMGGFLVILFHLLRKCEIFSHSMVPCIRENYEFPVLALSSGPISGHYLVFSKGDEWLGWCLGLNPSLENLPSSLSLCGNARHCS